MKNIFTLFCLLGLLSFWACEQQGTGVSHDPVQQAIDDRAIIEDYINDNNIEGTFTNSGLFYNIEEEGERDFIQNNDLLLFTITGTKLNGDEFLDFSDPTNGEVSILLEGLKEGVKLMRSINSKAHFILPSGLAYGDRDDIVEAHTVVQFDVEIMQTQHSVIEDYVTENGLNGEFTESGLFYAITELGDGQMPSSSASVTVKYKGTLLSGAVFDDSYDNTDSLAVFGLNQVIAGWTEGIPKIERGGKGILICPANLAYGSGSPSPAIPNYAILRFDVELVDF